MNTATPVALFCALTGRTVLGLAGVRESRQAGGDLEEQLWGGVGRAFPVAEKYGAVLGDTGAKSEELTPFLRGFLDEELKRSEPTGEKDAFSLGFEWEEPKTTKPSEEVEKDPFLIGFEGGGFGVNYGWPLRIFFRNI